MRRFVTLVFLLLFTIPFGISISGCGNKNPVVYCNGGDTGPEVGQVATITLLPRVYGISLNYAEIGQTSSPSATDCKGTAASVTSYTYGTTDMTIADVQPSTGKLCGGTWNRNTGGGIADYTTCMPTNKTGTAYITASGNGVASNPLPVFVHPVVTSVVLGQLSTDCINDPATNCSPAAFVSTESTCPINPANGCCTTPVVTIGVNPASGCISQGVTAQLAARVYAGTGTAQSNISCEVGHLTYTTQTTGLVTIDQNGIATAQQPGSTIVTANIANAGSSAGFFSTCPPTSITLSVPGTGGTSVSVNPNNTQPINVIATDQNNTVLTALNLEFVSTTPTTIPAIAAGTVTPTFPGAASITAFCQPPNCNPSPFNQIGLFGNGKPIASNPIEVTAPGNNSTLLYIASTQSLYLVPVDFTTTTIGTPVRLPFMPNSMVISEDGSTIYMGSSTELIEFSALTNAVSKEDQTVKGTVLAVSPDNSTVVMTDPTRQLIYLYSASGGAVASTYGGIATHAEFTPDSQTVYITTGTLNGNTITPSNQLLVHSTFTGWTALSASTPATDVAVTEPSVGAYFAGATTTARGSCPITTVTDTNGETTTSNVFYPDAGVTAPLTDRIVATNDGKHILGATILPTATLTDLNVTVPIGACPNAGLQFPTTPVLTSALSGVTATAITGVVPASDSTVAFVTYIGSGGVLPTYVPSTSGPGTLSNITLTGTATAPVTGVFSSDNFTFYVGTSGDNQVHLINRTTLTDDPTKTIAPKLIDVNGNIVTPDLIVQHPRKATS